MISDPRRKWSGEKHFKRIVRSIVSQQNRTRRAKLVHNPLISVLNFRNVTACLLCRLTPEPFGQIAATIFSG